ncbi:TPA: hypothetical protein DEF17_05635 [bacterium]|nr:hypothetical protein [bacterium]
MKDLFSTQAKICRIFTHPDRLRIVKTLCNGEKSVLAIARKLNLTQPKLSQHLALMRRLGVVATRRDHTTIYYSLSDPLISKACKLVGQITARISKQTKKTLHAVILLLTFSLLNLNSANAQEIRIHEVKQGETLFSISKSELGNGNVWTEIARFNDLEAPYKIVQGMQLKIPVAAIAGKTQQEEKTISDSKFDTATMIAIEPPGYTHNDSIATKPIVPRTAALPVPEEIWLSKEKTDNDPVLLNLISYAMNSSPAILRAKASVNAGRAGIDAAKSSYMPTIGLSERYMVSDDPPSAFMSILQQGRLTPQVQASMNNTEAVEDWATRLYAKALLLDFGQRSGQVSAAVAETKRRQSMLSAIKRDVAFNVADAYYRSLEADAAVQLWSETVRLFETHRSIAKAHYEAGTVLLSDLLSVEVGLADARANYVRAKNDAAIVKLELKSIIGINSVSGLEPKRLGIPLYQKTEEEVLNAALNSHPLIVAALNAEEFSQAMERVAVGSSLPTVAGEVFGEWHGEDEGVGFDRRSVTAAVILDVPIFDGWRARAKRKEARAQRNEAVEARREVVSQLELAAVSLHRRTLEALERIEIADKAVEAARESLSIIENRYSAGLAKIDELLQVERNLTESRLNALSARTHAWISVAGVERVAGKEVER